MARSPRDGPADRTGGNHVEDRLESGCAGRTGMLAHDGFGGLASAIMARAAWMSSPEGSRR
jgi:hypothetical protein